MPDLTQAFRATVQELSTSGAPRPAAKPRTPKATPDPWLKEAHQISKTMADLRAFIITTRPAYLNLSRNAGMSGMRIPRRSDSIPKAHNNAAMSASSKALHDLLGTVSSLTSLSDKDRDSIDTQVKVMMRQIKGAIEELESLEQDRRKNQQKGSKASGGILAAGLSQLMAAVAGPLGADNLAQHRQGVTLYLNERLAALATLHKDQYEARIAREMEKRESSLFKALPKPSSVGLTNGDGPGASGLSRRNQGMASPGVGPGNSYSGASTPTSSSAPSLRSGTGTIGSSKVDSATGYSSSQYYQNSAATNFGRHSNQSTYKVEEDDDFEQSLTAEERQMLEMENENIVQKLETELNQVRQIESSMLELSSLHSTIQEHLEIQTQQTNRLHEESLTAIDHISAGNDQLLKAGKRNDGTRKWILFFLILASFVLLFLDWYD
ncbi:MAG: hypothetical protein BYD32DRAFT_405078 [Podila humilis]|nr:MAG: hypothetical protein BYD32DRAFT_405078 [Podila humilis]